MSRGKWVTLKLHQLRLDQANYRTGPQTTQRDAIRAMIEDQGIKLVRLARDIILMGGVSPGEPIWVVASGTRGQYVVEEGNRRVTALKLLETPALADGTSVSKQFRRLAKMYAEHPIRDVDARLFDNRDDVAPWKRRRHMTAGSGVGLDRWNTLGKGRANRDIGLDAPRSLAVVELFADDKSDTWAELLEALDGRWTTVDRVLNSAPFNDVLGVHIDTKTSVVSFENGDDRAGRELLKRILGAMAASDFEFAQVEDKDDRAAFVGKFADFNVKARPGEIGRDSSTLNPTSPAEAALQATPAHDRSQPLSDPDRPAAPPGPSVPEPAEPEPPSRRDTADANRKTLAPPDGPRLLPVEGIRLHPLYNECRKLKVKGNENAAAFLVRVFIELSSENYLQEKKVDLPRSLKDKNIKDWEDYKVKLSDKITAVAFHIDPTKKAPVFVQARQAIEKDSVGPFSINTLHSYFHNRHVLPEEATIKASWDGWEAYLRELYVALKGP